jgi:hypothetical protein
MSNRKIIQSKFLALLPVGAIFLAGCAAFVETRQEASACLNSSTQSATVASEKRHFERVLIIVLENKDEQEVRSNQYFKELASKGTYLSNFHGLYHPSYSNYLAMVSGRKIETYFDKQINIADFCSIADQLQDKNLRWKNYAEGYPADGKCHSQPATIGRYARKHVPFMSFKNIQSNPDSCRNILPGEQFLIDWKNRNLPEYSFYSPDMDNDGHDLPLGAAEVWLKSFLNPLLADEQLMKDTLIVLTFDESGEQSKQGENHIYTLFLGGMVKPSETVNTHYNHFNVLRTIEDNFGLQPMADGDGCSRPIVEAWK